MDINISEVEEDFDTRYVDYLGARFSFSGAAHLSRYLWVKKFVKNKRILDAGCGSGYGDNILIESAKKIAGIDISKNAIEYARKRYRANNLKFVEGDLNRIKPKEKFDMIISFDVIEHIAEVDGYLASLINNLTEDGVVIIGTPNLLARYLYNISENPFHVKEYSPDDLRRLLLKYFDDVKIVGQEVINKNKNRYLLEKIIQRRDKSEKEIGIKKFKDKGKSIVKSMFPFWIKALYKIIRLYLYFIIKPKEIIFIKDIGFSENTINAFGLIAICKSKKRDN